MQILFTLLGVAAGYLLSRSKNAPASTTAEQKTENPPAAKKKYDTTEPLPADLKDQIKADPFEEFRITPRYESYDEIPQETVDGVVRIIGKLEESGEYLGLFAGMVPADYERILEKRIEDEALRSMARQFRSGTLPERWRDKIDTLIDQKLKERLAS